MAPYPEKPLESLSTDLGVLGARVTRRYNLFREQRDACIVSRGLVRPRADIVLLCSFISNFYLADAVA